MPNKYEEDETFSSPWTINKDSPPYWRRYRETLSYEDEAPKSSYQMREDEVNNPSHYVEIVSSTAGGSDTRKNLVQTC